MVILSFTNTDTSSPVCPPSQTLLTSQLFQLGLDRDELVRGKIRLLKKFIPKYMVNMPSVSRFLSQCCGTATF